MNDESYKKCECGEHCYKIDSDELCYGKVVAIDEIFWGNELGYSWVHACEGHAAEYLEGKYLIKEY